MKKKQIITAIIKRYVELRTWERISHLEFASAKNKNAEQSHKDKWLTYQDNADEFEQLIIAINDNRKINIEALDDYATERGDKFFDTKSMPVLNLEQFV